MAPNKHSPHSHLLHINLLQVQALYVLLRDAIAEAGVADAPALLKEAYLMLRAVVGRSEGDDFQHVSQRWMDTSRQMFLVWDAVISTRMSVAEAQATWRSLAIQSAMLRADVVSRCRNMEVVRELRAHDRRAPLPGGLRLSRSLWTAFDMAWREWPGKVAERRLAEDHLTADFAGMMQQAEDYVREELIAKHAVGQMRRGVASAVAEVLRQSLYCLRLPDTQMGWYFAESAAEARAKLRQVKAAHGGGGGAAAGHVTRSPGCSADGSAAGYG